jgi:hypothetical protein
MMWMSERFDGWLRKAETQLDSPWVFHIVVSLLVLLTIGLRLLFWPPDKLNPDTFAWLGTANYYLFDSAPKPQDGFTVGPVVPGLIALLKGSLSHFLPWDRNADIYLVKGMSLLCYLAILNAAGSFLKRSASPSIVILFLALFLGLERPMMDSLSLNGELVSLAWLTMLLALLPKRGGAVWLGGVCLLTCLTIYSKLQSLPFLALLLLADFPREDKGWHRKLLILVGSIIFAELLNFVIGIGLIRRLGDIWTYLLVTKSESPLIGQEGSGGILGIFYGKYIYNLQWAMVEATKLLPVFLVALFGALMQGRKNLGAWARNPVLWLLVLLFTILTSGRRFEHYLLYVLFFTIVFSEPVLAALSRTLKDSSRRIMVAFGLAFMALLVLAISILAIERNREGKGLSIPAFQMGQDADQVAALVGHDRYTVFVHGWDTRFYSYLNTGPRGGEWAWVEAGAMSRPDYLNSIVRKRHPYILDVMTYSGLIRSHALGMTSNTLYGAALRPYYDLVFDKNGLRLFRLKANPPPPTIFSDPQPVHYSIEQASVGCQACLPQAFSAPGYATAWSTFGPNGEASTGRFMAQLQRPLGPVAGIKFARGTSVEGLAINIQRICSDGKVQREPVAISKSKVNEINAVYVDTFTCSPTSVVLEFVDSGENAGQWIALLGVDRY